MKEQSPRLLLIGHSPEHLDLLHQVLAKLPTGSGSVTQVHTLGAAERSIQEAAYDLVVLDWDLQSMTDGQALAWIEAHSGATHVVVLTPSVVGALGERAQQSGALDSLAADDAHLEWLLRWTRFALRRSARLRSLATASAVTKREVDDLGHLARDPGTSVTSQIYDSPTLSVGQTPDFLAAFERYQALLEGALERRVHGGDDDSARELRELGDRLGLMRASPRDVVEIHTRAIKQRVEDAKPARLGAYVEEGRLLVLELMGHLANFYRAYYHPLPRKGAINE